MPLIFIETILNCIDEPIVESGDTAPSFRPGMVRELCQSEPNTEKRIMFIETSGQTCLRPRQACAIESAAITNPNMTVYVYIALKPPPGVQKTDKQDGLQSDSNCKTTDMLSNLPNVQFIYEDLTKYFRNTPLEPFVMGNALDKSKYPYQHMSDALRIALLYKYGGIVLDTDVMVLRSLHCLRNVVGQIVNWGKFGMENSVLIFDKGHQILRFFMKLMKQIYNPEYKEVIGPVGLLQAFRIFCNFTADGFYEYGNYFECHNKSNVTVLHTAAFFPILHAERDIFFNNNFPSSYLNRFQTSYAVDVYGSGHEANVPEASLYSFLAERFCPTIYSGGKNKLYNF